MYRLIEIESFDAPELDVYARLTENQLVNRQEPKNAMFIAESPKVIERALDAGYEPVSCLMEKRHIEVRDICVGCGECFRRCGQRAISMADGAKTVTINVKRCVLCGYCRDNCEHDAIRIY